MKKKLQGLWYLILIAVAVGLCSAGSFWHFSIGNTTWGIVLSIYGLINIMCLYIVIFTTKYIKWEE